MKIYVMIDLLVYCITMLLPQNAFEYSFIEASLKYVFVSEIH